MKKIFYCLLLFTFSFLGETVAQITPEDAIVRFTGTGTQKNCFFTVVLPSAENILSIRVRLGPHLNEYDLLDHVFAFDVNSGLPSGYSYSRIDKICILGVGILEEPQTLFGEVLIQDIDGNWGMPFQFVSN